MFSLRRPDATNVQKLIAAQRDQPLTYRAVGITRAAEAPFLYLRDHRRVKLGHGAAVFTRAVDALRAWRQFPGGWAELAQPAGATAVGTLSVVLARFGPLKVANVTRIVYVLDEEIGSLRRWGYAFGTLPAHVARGEERFAIEWDRRDDSVWYDLLAVSRPSHPLAWLGFPALRLAQRRFGRESLAAMVQAVAE